MPPSAFPQELLPACPRRDANGQPLHPGSRIGTWGTYGQQRTRQRFRCRPVGSTGFHTFGAAPMSRPLPFDAHVSCRNCVRPFHLHDSPPAFRGQMYSVAEIVNALLSVAGGASYRKAALELHRVTGARRLRRRSDPGPRLLDDSQAGTVISDWVELCAPPLFDFYMKGQRVDGATLLIDETPYMFNGRAPGNIPGRHVAFHVWVIGAYFPTNPRLRILRAFTTVPFESIAPTLHRLEGVPARVLTDDDKQINAAVELIWPTAERELCLWHLKHRARAILAANGRKLTPVYAALGNAFNDEASWVSFQSAYYGQDPELDRWAARLDTRLRRQLRLGLQPTTTGALEQSLSAIKASFMRRKTGFKNQARTDRLLQLMALHLNGNTHPLDWAGILTDHGIGGAGAMGRRHTLHRSVRFK